MRGVTAFITRPICFIDGLSPSVAVTAATSSSTIAAISASVSCCGRYSARIAASASSFSASSGLLPLV